MSALGNIAHRLRTDIGENLRAMVDVNYSRQLTEDRFNQRAQDKKFQQEQQIRETIRTQELEDEQRRNRLNLQLLAGNKLFEGARDTGNWGSFLNYIENQNLDPDVAQYMRGLAEAQGSRSLDSIKVEHGIKMDFERLSAEQQKAALEKEQYETSRQQKEAEFALKAEKLRFEKMQDLRETNAQRNNRRDMITFIEETPDIETEDERRAFLTRLESAEGSPDAVNRVWDEIMARLGNRLSEREKNYRAKLQADSQPPLTVAPSKVELDFARDALRSALPDAFDALPDSEKDNQQERFVRAVAVEMKKLSRDARVSQLDAVTQAIENVRGGLTFEEDGGWFFFDKGEFSTSKAALSKRKTQGLPPPGISEEDIAFTMQSRTMTRQQVLDKLYRDQYGID